MTEGFKSGFVGIIGRPNVGKSTLLNAIVGEKVAITTPKPQTTRNSIRGIYNEDGLQLVFIDTPGIHKPRTKLGEFMTGSALSTFEEVDVILFLTDDVIDKGPGDRYIIDLLKKTETPKLLLINKTDLLGPETYKEIYDAYESMGLFDEIIGISAKKKTNTDLVIEKVKGYIEEGPMYFPEDMITDDPERFLVSEIIREKLLLYLKEEVPHGVAVEIEYFNESERLTEIGAIIYCEKKSHKGIIIGKDGHTLKGVGIQARKEIESLLGTRVILKTWVKVKTGWRDSDIALSNFGYREQK